MEPVWELPLSPDGILFNLRKGGRVQIRPSRAGDDEVIKQVFERLSPESRYLRFFSARSSLGDGLAKSLTDIDHARHCAWAVFDPDEPSGIEGITSGLPVAAARLIRDLDDATSAEAALTVVDAYHNRGIGRFLIELLVHTAADMQVTTLRFEILRENRSMLRLIGAMDATRHDIPDDRTVVEYRLSVPEPNELDVPAGALYELLRRLE